MYGAPGKHAWDGQAGFLCYTSDDLENWSEPIECFNSNEFDMNRAANWAPEVHKYKGDYYMFATAGVSVDPTTGTAYGIFSTADGQGKEYQVQLPCQSDGKGIPVYRSAPSESDLYQYPLHP